MISESESGVAVLLNVSSHKTSFHQWTEEFIDPLPDDQSGPSIRKVDFRTYGVGAQILKDQGVGKMQLLAKPGPISGMSAYQLEVVGYSAPTL
jgi:3,4-dihydroxy 2-butanone 4-phosphate synthase/GTP cyclohydrolase II